MSVLYPGILPPTFGALAGPGTLPNTFTSGAKFPNVIVPSGNDARSAAVFAQSAQDLTDRTNAIAQEMICWNSGGNYSGNTAEVTIGNQMLWEGQHTWIGAGPFTVGVPATFSDTVHCTAPVTMAPSANDVVALTVVGANSATPNSVSAITVSGGNLQRAVDVQGGNGAMAATFTPGSGENRAAQILGDLDLAGGAGKGNLLRTGADKPTGAEAYRKLRVATLVTTTGTVTVSGSDQDVLEVTGTGGGLTINLSTPADPVRVTIRFLAASSAQVIVKDAAGGATLATFTNGGGAFGAIVAVNNGTHWFTEAFAANGAVGAVAVSS